ncbi:MAG TPA: hypothetical protein VLU96_01195 [Gaiellaceae bacterium]|nr:hypothetical protein [Gaiellaceae bacterium]
MRDDPHPTSRRQAFALAAALTLTVLTGGAALTGLRHGVSHASPPAAVVQLAQPPAPAPPRGEESD